MFKKRRGRRKQKISVIQRFFRSVIAVVILSAFVLGISLMVKEMAGLDPYGLVKLAGPVLDKIGVSTEEAGQVAGTFAERILKTNIAPSETFKEDLGTKGSNITGDLGDNNNAYTSRQVVFKAALMGDSANDNESLRKALIIAEGLEVNRVFFLGDYTNLGVLENLERAKAVMDESSIMYYSLPGDRDLDINSDPANFENYHSVFGEPRRSVTFNDNDIGKIKFTMLNNSANYTLIDAETLGQFYQELNDVDYVVLSQPLYHPLASYGKPVMGIVNGELVANVKEQAEEILGMIRNSSAKAIIAGDQHAFDTEDDVVKEELKHIYIGPVSKEKAERSINSITLLTIYDDDSFSVEEVFID